MTRDLKSAGVAAMPGADTRKTEAVERLVDLAGLSKSEAESVVDAAVRGAEDQAFETIVGAGPLPSSLAAFRAQQLHYACLNAKRILSQREVEVLFRATPTQARTIMTTMNATYEQALRGHLRDQMIQDADVSPTGTEESELTWTIRFTERSSYEFALNEVDRLGFDRWASSMPSRLSLVLPRELERDGKKADPLKDIGLKKP
jgi:hypothetical protein